MACVGASNREGNSHIVQICFSILLQRAIIERLGSPRPDTKIRREAEAKDVPSVGSERGAEDGGEEAEGGRCSRPAEHGWACLQPLEPARDDARTRREPQCSRDWRTRQRRHRRHVFVGRHHHPLWAAALVDTLRCINPSDRRRFREVNVKCEFL